MMSLNEQFINGLECFLKEVGTPAELLNSPRKDLYNIFVKLKESGNISEEIFDDVTNALQAKKPTREE